jgi:hypothetical protein
MMQVALAVIVILGLISYRFSNVVSPEWVDQRNNIVMLGLIFTLTFSPNGRAYGYGAGVAYC